MAENALYISSVDQVKPTVFELVAQESLMNTLQPSYDLLCRVLRIKFGNQPKWFFRFQEEWYLVLNLLVQSRYMRLFGSSFSEAFYSLKRVPVSQSKNGVGNLSAYSKVMSLFCIVGVPYLSLKLKRLIDTYQLQEEININSSLDKRKITMAMNSYKSICAFYELAKLYYLIRYISGFSDIHSPLLKLCSVKLVYHSVDVPSWKEIITDYFSNKKRLSKILLPVSTKLFSQLLEFGAFTVQFLSWWHSGEVKTHLNTLPAPPSIRINSSENKDLCPICHQKRKVEVALQCSGYVYCYRCIREVLQQTGKCPVTNLPALPEQLIRLYPDQ